MVKNLIKAPLLAIFITALFYLAGVYIPFSEEFSQLSLEAEFTPGLFDLIYLFGFVLCLTVLMAVGYGNAGKGGIKTISLLTTPLIGAAFIMPRAESLLYPEHVGTLNRGDAIWSGIFYIACMVLSLVLMFLNFRHKPPPPEPDPLKPEPIVTYKLRIIPFIVKIIVSPLICLVFYLVSWYYLLWGNATAREFHGGPEEPLSILSTMATVFMDMDWMVLFALIIGMAYTLLSLPLLFVFKAKRILYIILTVFINLSGVLWMYIPSPLMGDTVRLWTCIYMAAVLIAYGGLMAFLLHICWHKHVEEPPPPPPKKLSPKEAALEKARAKAKGAKAADVLPGIPAQEAAAMVSNTIKGK